MMTRTRTPKVKEFVNPPFIRCPDCGQEKFGVLMICDRHYVRRCIHCWFDKSFPLSPVRKKLIYLDQFVISNVMKELDPAASTKAKGVKDGFYRLVFEKLDQAAPAQGRDAIGGRIELAHGAKHRTAIVDDQQCRRRHAPEWPTRHVRPMGVVAAETADARHAHTMAAMGVLSCGRKLIGLLN